MVGVVFVMALGLSVALGVAGVLAVVVEDEEGVVTWALVVIHLV